MRAFSGATACSTSDSVKRGVMYCGQFQSKLTTSIRKRRSILLRSSGVGVSWSEGSGCSRASSPRVAEDFQTLAFRLGDVGRTPRRRIGGSGAVGSRRCRGASSPLSIAKSLSSGLCRLDSREQAEQNLCEETERWAGLTVAREYLLQRPAKGCDAQCDLGADEKREREAAGRETWHGQRRNFPSGHGPFAENP